MIVQWVVPPVLAPVVQLGRCAAPPAGSQMSRIILGTDILFHLTGFRIC